ncbi:MAG: serine O-acetyltransferase [Gammaproteobacteria bacterium]
MFNHFREDIACVFDRDPAAKSTFEVITTYPGLHAILVHRLSHKLWQKKLYWLARMVSHTARWITGIEIHPGAVIGRRFFIDHGMGVVIGETAEIGDDCTLYHGVTLGGTTWNKGKRHPTLMNGVVIGAGAKVLGPITLHDCSRIGSNSVVVKDVPECATVVGVPGQLIIPKEQQTQREELAEKIGFDAYGSAQDMPDPVANALGGMLDHIQNLEKEIKDMRDNLQNEGSADAWQVGKSHDQK